MLEIKYARLDDEAKANEGHLPRLHPFSKFVCSYFAACIAQTGAFASREREREREQEKYS